MKESTATQLLFISIKNIDYHGVCLSLENGADPNGTASGVFYNFINFHPLDSVVNICNSAIQRKIHLPETEIDKILPSSKLIISALLNSGSDPFMFGSSMSILANASRNNNVIFKILEKEIRKRKLLQKNGNNILHALLQSLYKPDMKHIFLCLKNGCDVNAFNCEKQTPLHCLWSDIYSHDKVVNMSLDMDYFLKTTQELIKFGADVNIIDIRGQSAISIIRRTIDVYKNYVTPELVNIYQSICASGEKKLLTDHVDDNNNNNNNNNKELIKNNLIRKI